MSRLQRYTLQAVKLVEDDTGLACKYEDAKVVIDALESDNKRLREALERIRDHHQCHDCEYYQKKNMANCCDATVMMVNKALAAGEG